MDKQIIIYELIIDKLERVMEFCEKSNVPNDILNEIEDIIYYVKREKGEQ